MNEVVETEQKRIVTLSDGTTADFGKRNNVLQSFDTETGVVTFKVFTGEVIELDLTKIEDLKFSEQSALAKTFIGYAAGTKVKISIASTKLTEVSEDGEIIHSLADGIAKVVASLEAGEFSTRSGDSSDEETLDDNIKYFAIAAASFPKYPYYNAEFAPAVHNEEGYLLFNDEVEGDIVSKIVSVWESLSTKEKNKAKRDQHFKMVEGRILTYLFEKANA